MHTAYAPGRVELLGNHTDYNQGYVLSAAIDRGVTQRGEATGDGTIRVYSAALDRTYETRVEELAPSRDEEWANYVLGMFASMKGEGMPISGFRTEIESNLPLGAGLSSSAALEVSTGKLLEKIFGFRLDPMTLAKLARRAENEFVGVACGLLDQASSVFGKAGHAIYLDCWTEVVRTIAFPEGVSLLITQCGVAHQLSGGEYNERREQCFDAAKHLGVFALRDAKREHLEAARDEMPRLSYLRASHIIGENDRVRAGVEALKSGDVATFGKLMFESHESSIHNFENSTPELDELVAIARTLPGVLGSRLTGGGFGGATVSLVETDKADGIREALTTRYQKATGYTAHAHLCALADGAH